MTLREFFARHPRAAIAFSGGTDSAYLLHAARQCGADVTAYYVASAFQPQFELRDARRLAEALRIPLRVLPVDVLSDPRVACNAADRCYHCKRAIFDAIARAAARDGYSLLLDGTNASDQAADRPGMQALQELQVLSPLRLCGLSKADIRQLSRQAGLFTWDKPAYACLATRIPTGQPITPGDLQCTEAAEEYLSSLGFSDFRVRMAADHSARIQLPEEQLPLLLEHRQEIIARLRQSYPAVTLDLEVRT